jgi:hypothetical protein
VGRVVISVHLPVNVTGMFPPWNINPDVPGNLPPAT